MNITLDTPLHKLFLKNIINISCFLLLNREIYVLILRNMRGYMVCLLFFSRILQIRKKYGIIPAKNGIPQIRARYTPSRFPSHFRKYGNGRDKYRNTNRTGRDFFRPFSSLYRGDIYFFYLNFEVSGSLKMRPVVGGL